MVSVYFSVYVAYLEIISSAFACTCEWASVLWVCVVCTRYAFVEVWVSLCWTWRVIAAFVDCWRQVVSHLVTAGKREGWRGFGNRGVLSGRGRDGCSPPSITHGWTAGTGAMGGIGGRGRTKERMRDRDKRGIEILCRVDWSVCVDMCRCVAVRMLLWQWRDNEIEKQKEISNKKGVARLVYTDRYC